MKFILSYVVFFVFGFLTLIIFKLQNPTSMNFVKEGGLVENLTALFFFLSFLVALIMIFKNREKFFSALIALAGFSAFGDELEWGRKILGYKAVLYIGKKRIDSVHDFLDPMSKFFKRFPKNDFVLVGEFLVFILVSILIYKKRNFLINFFFRKKMIFPWIMGGLFVFSFLLDHGNIDIPENIFNLNAVILEECIELAAAVALFFLSLELFWKSRETIKTQESLGS